ncbi:molecular chaperone Skp [Mesotoga sp. Brook.08.YT.4.2.5.1]|uniref:OmpH family outer membrane protein n=1 Tax=unclassified Mesotoga TaxID=1184398 RepID=UPI000C1A0EF0|nr:MULTISPECIES: OmpH family outer membrane protein [unclassified Mesotoga]PNQ05166.1 molecular chaperone Skp [Mesotoga sp. SC_NapDC3]PXF34214.1 molecular chaperone Skp [Mesotoga sp. SC_NapDC]RIZ61110.1 molecular chaperone Skp [Mesotoga sp. SC_NapDC2]HNU24109.1 OmpH family outer membrane protein [Mesotoga sp.]PNE22364.1 molecular chaperone Skp [Mesotoga sp. Brook.08.YT.4.2.5.1]
MKRSMKFILIVIMVAAVGAIVVSESSAGPSNPAKIAFADMQKVLESTRDWVTLNTDYQKDTQFYQGQLDSLSREYQDLANSGASQEALLQKQQEILTKKSQYEQTLETTYNAKLQVILEQVNKRIRDYATFIGIDMVISDEIVVYGSSAYNITDAIIEYMKGFQN